MQCRLVPRRLQWCVAGVLIAKGPCLSLLTKPSALCSESAASRLAVELLRSEPADIELFLPRIAACADERLGGDFSPVIDAISAHGLRLGNIAAVRAALLGECNAGNKCE